MYLSIHPCFPRDPRFNHESVVRVVADPSSVYSIKWNTYYRHKYVVRLSTDVRNGVDLHDLHDLHCSEGVAEDKIFAVRLRSHEQ